MICPFDTPLRDGRPLLRALRAVSALLPLLAMATAAAGRAEPSDVAPPGLQLAGGEAHVQASLVFDAGEARAGGELGVGVLFEIEPGWHIYWRNPGESGIATQLAWHSPQAEVGDIEWPVPRVFRESEGLITTYGYSERVLLAARARVAPDASERLEIEVEADFLICRVECLPGSLQLAAALPIGAADLPVPAPPERDWLAFEQRRMPVAPETLGLESGLLLSQSALRPGDPFEAAIAIAACTPQAGSDASTCPSLESAQDAADAAFIPEAPGGIDFETRARVLPNPASDRGFVVALRGETFDDGDDRLRGLLPVRARGEVHYVELDLPLARAERGAAVEAIGSAWIDGGGAAAAEAASHSSVGVLEAILFALIGGLILNAMPCVLPVLAIKVFAVTEMAQHSRRDVLAHAAAYTAGILASMWALAAVVVALRAGGEAIGWGFQFQEPLFVAAVGAVLVVFALNLFGVFEFSFASSSLAGVGAQASGARRSFFEGLLAVVLATPCSAPFLGTAVGLAFAGSPALIVVIFTAIGLGLASPFLLVSASPALARYLPRSGAWMNTLRAGLGFAVLATVLWLMWVAGRLTGVDGIATLGAFLLAVAFATWIFGQLQRSGRGARSAAALLSAGGLLALAALPLEPSTASKAEAAGEGLGAQPYARAALEAELAAGRPAFVYYTADWCLTCKVNERTVLASESLHAELDRLDVAVFKADWTHRDDTIRAELARLGKAGVPVYAVYRADRPDQPELLPELLTQSRLLETLRIAAAASRNRDRG